MMKGCSSPYQVEMRRGFDMKLNNISNKKEEKKRLSGKGISTTVITRLTTNKKRITEISSIEQQRSFFDSLFLSLKLITLDDWQTVSKKKIIRLGGKKLLEYYNNDLKKLLISLYPFHPWQFDKISSFNKNEYFKSIDNQRKFMEDLFFQLNFNSLDNFLLISKRQIVNKGGKSLLQFYYANDFSNLLSSIFPFYPWEFNKEKEKIQKNFNLKDEQEKFMEKLYRKLNLSSLSDWLQISRRKILNNGGKKLLDKIYSSHFDILLSSIYPNYPWQFDNLKIYPTLYFKSILNQRKFVDNLFYHFKLTTLDDWRNISKKKIIKKGGKSLVINYYVNNKEILLSNIYPYFPWQWNEFDILFIDNQKKLMDEIFIKLNFSHLNDWKKVTRNQLIKNGGKPLIKIYKNNFISLLSSIYPSHNWMINNDKGEKFLFRYKPSLKYSKSFDYLKDQLKRLQKKYAIKEKKDWYRVPLKSGDFRIYRSLKLLYPSLHWEKKLFQIRSKKTIQRLLFSLVEQLYPSYLLLENYYHPLLLHYHNEALEFDLFLPSFNLAFEYQGEHHYNDMPSNSNHLELYQSRDRLKEKLTSLLSIQLISVPFWWDHSMPSLLSSFPQLYENNNRK